MPLKNSRFISNLLILGSIRQTAGRIVLSTLLIIVVCVSVLSYTFYVPTSREVQNQAEKQMELYSSLLAKEIDANLVEKQAIMKVIAEQGSNVEADRQQQLDFIIQAHNQHPEFESLYFSLDLIGANAVNVKNTDVDLSDRPYIKLAQEGKPFISDPVISKTRGTMVVIVGAPLIKDGKAYGFYGASYSISEAVQGVSTAQFGETGKAYMTLADGTFLSHPDETYLLSKKLSDLGIAPLDQALANATQGNTSAIHFTENGAKKIGFMSVTGLNWVITMFAEESEILKPVNTLLNLIVLVGSGIIILALIMTILIALRIVYPIRQLTHGIDVLAQGDLTYRIPVKGKTDISKALHSFNAAGDQIQLLMKEVNGLSEQLTDSAKQLAEGADQGARAAQSISEAILVVAESSERQTSSLQDGSQAADSIAVQIDGIASYSTNAADIASEASNLSDDGAASMDQLNGKMVEMEQGIGELAQTIHALSGLSGKIGDVVGSISQIARQTNILSLNAAIEASRSGEAGRGFAVVADEIRKLAGQSMESAEQIAGFIGSIRLEIDRTLQASEQTVTQAAEGRHTGEEARELFTRIRSSIQEVAASIQGVSTASSEMVSGTATLVESIRLISDSASETAAESQNVSAAAEQQMASMEEVASSSAELANMAEKLRIQINKFKL
ncbi:methyl-accepting chemotaxis sensory transducer with Cache sensor [Paenibacillus algorifonticola]|uniref:Methyl-accepting chemotaxis sensory transducer with Cache sensor n=1 Tax=Paenibacillus algorifonticola TaxID=684063 RepID=A0A1I2FKW2_9BACL|nr:methyl-accepting chemotaxis protein [Paenibacillus algorifonticola]SFF05489.1 methyl-accepting chemotaxis sensory transducer with Cache sensor [Paenibacillus algorifonticola]